MYVPAHWSRLLSQVEFHSYIFICMPSVHTVPHAGMQDAKDLHGRLCSDDLPTSVLYKYALTQCATRNFLHHTTFLAK